MPVFRSQLQKVSSPAFNRAFSWQNKKARTIYVFCCSKDSFYRFFFVSDRIVCDSPYVGELQFFYIFFPEHNVKGHFYMILVVHLDILRHFSFIQWYPTAYIPVSNSFIEIVSFRIWFFWWCTIIVFNINTYSFQKSLFVQNVYMETMVPILSFQKLFQESLKRARDPCIYMIISCSKTFHLFWLFELSIVIMISRWRIPFKGTRTVFIIVSTV